MTNIFYRVDFRSCFFQKLFPHSFLSHLPLKQFPHPCILDEDDQGGVADLSCRLCQLAQLKNLKMIKVKMKVKIMKVEWQISPVASVNSHNSRTFESGQLMFQEYLACSSKNMEFNFSFSSVFFFWSSWRISLLRFLSDDTHTVICM